MSDTVPLGSLAGAIGSALIGALFAGVDTALTSVTSHRLSALIEQAEGAPKLALERVRRDDLRIRSTYLLGRIACIALTAVELDRFFAATLPAIAPYMAAAATLVLIGVLAEISTTLGRRHADSIVPAAARYLRPLEFLFVPLAVPLSLVGAWLRGKNGEQHADPRVAEAEVEIMVEEVERSGLFGHEPAEMIRNVLEFADRTAQDVMIRRGSIEAIDLDTPIDQVVTIVTEGGHSRYPVYREHIDHVVGLLNAKDLFQALEKASPEQRSEITLNDVIRTPVNFVAESQPLSSLLREMRSQRQHLAIVVDEFGGVSGIVTLEDVLEEIVGDIQDEHDVDEASAIEDLGDGRVVANANITMSDLSRYLGTEIPGQAAHESLEGMLTQHAGRIPTEGTAINKHGFRFIVRDADDKHIGKVEIIRPRSATA